jgi:hypothetical protein
MIMTVKIIKKPTEIVTLLMFIQKFNWNCSLYNSSSSENSFTSEGSVNAPRSDDSEGSFL